MADDWITVPGAEWETLPVTTEADWETVPEEDIATRVKRLPERVVGALARGTMQLGEALTRLPEMAVRQAKMLPAATLASQILREKDPQKRKQLLFKMRGIEETYTRIADELGRAGDLQQIGQNVIERNHPEWQYDPPRGFRDLLLSPDKAMIMLAESTPLLVAAGVFTAAAQPQLSVALMYAAEGQSAYDQAIQYGATDDQATAAYAMYAPVAAMLEQMQLMHVMKISKGMFNHVLHRTASKVAGKTITKQLVRVAAQEAIEEIAQGRWEDITARVVYGRPLGSLKEIADRSAQEGYLGGLMGLIPGVGGLTVGKTVATIRGKKYKVQKETPKAEQLGDIKVTKETIQESPNLTPEEKAVGERYIGDIETRIVNEAVERFPEEIKDQASLEKIGNKIAAWLGIERKIKWKWPKRPSRRLAGTARRFKNEITVYPSWNQKGMKETIVHELGHFAKPPIKITKPPLTKLPSGFKSVEAGENQWITVNRSNNTYGYGATKKIAEIEALRVLNSEREFGGRRKIHHPEFKKWVEDGVRKLSRPVERGIEPIHREEAIGPIEEVPPIVKEKPKKPPSRKRLLTLGHKIAKQTGWDENQRRDFMENITGKRSMKDMTKPEMQRYVDTLQEETGITPTIPKRKGDDPITLGDRATTMNEVMGDAANVVDGLPEKVDVPEHIKRTFLRKQRGGVVRRLKHILWGIDNSPLYQLANILGNGKDSIFTEVFDTNIQKARKIEVAHKRTVILLLQQAFEDAGITPDDLAKISNSVNPRFTWYQFIQEKYGVGTQVIPVKIGKKTFDMNLGELLDVYLISEQEDGMRHLLGGGLIINGVETGALTAKIIGGLRTYITRDAKLQTIADTFTAVQENIWKPSLNQTALTLGEKPIATKENWWGLDVYYPKQLPGKERRFEVNLIENKSIFKDRTRSKRPLVIRDAFQRFLTFENAIAEYIAFSQPLRIARTVINNPDLAAVADTKGFKDVWNNIRNILDRTQSLQRPRGKLEALISKILPGVYRAVLFFNPRVILSQYTSVANYAAFVSPKYMNLITKGVSPKAIEETLELSDIAWDRFYMGHSSYELGEIGAADAVLKFFTKTSADINKLGISLKLADMAALTSGLEIAKAEYKDAQNETIAGDSARWWAGEDASFEEGSESWKQAVTKRAEWLWQRSQPSWDKWNRSMLTSDPSAIRRIFFLFRSFHEKSLAILQGAHTEYANSDKTTDDTARFAKKYGAVLTGYTVNTILRALVMVGLRRKIKEPFEYLTDLITAPFAMLPLLGKILQTSIRSFINAVTEHAPEYRGEALESLPVRVINTIAKAPDNFSRAVGYYLAGEPEKAQRSLEKAVGALYEGIGMAEGVPVHEIRGIYKGWIKEEEPGGKQRRKRSE